MWLAPDPYRFNPEERVSCAHSIGGWTGPRAGLNALERIKISASAGNRTPNQTLSHVAWSLSCGHAVIRMQNVPICYVLTSPCFFKLYVERCNVHVYLSVLVASVLAFAACTLPVYPEHGSLKPLGSGKQHFWFHIPSWFLINPLAPELFWHEYVLEARIP